MNYLFAAQAMGFALFAFIVLSLWLWFCARVSNYAVWGAFLFFAPLIAGLFFLLAYKGASL